MIGEQTYPFPCPREQPSVVGIVTMEYITTNSKVIGAAFLRFSIVGLHAKPHHTDLRVNTHII